MINKVLVPVDGTADAETALNYAIRFSSALGAKLTVACMTGLGCDAQSSRIDESSEKAGAEIKVDRITIEGDAVRGLASCGNRHDIDLMIMVAGSTPEASGNAMADIGMKVLRQTKTPVLLIKPDKKHEQSGGLIKKILVPLDESEASEMVLDYVAEIAAAFDAELVLLDVIPFDEREPVVALSTYLTRQEKAFENRRILGLHYLNQTSSRLKEQHKDMKVSCETRQGPAATEITDCANEVKADLVAMLTRAHTGLKRLVFGSTASEVINHCDKNLLLMKLR